jgi:hypothetical protein
VDVVASGFSPAHIGVSPGTTVTWRLTTYETVSVLGIGVFSANGSRLQPNVSAEAELVPLDSGALNRNWQPNYSFTFDAGHFPTDVTWTYRDAHAGSRIADELMHPTGSVLVKDFSCEQFRVRTHACLGCPALPSALRRASTSPACA